jgi:hypothetical protein
VSMDTSPRRHENFWIVAVSLAIFLLRREIRQI